jgi:5-oxoprolinase (ATP-hydrolysing)
MPTSEEHAGVDALDSTHVDEEGVLLDNVQLVAEGRFSMTAMRAILGSGWYPSRNIGQNLADLRAQVAACAKGIDELKRMVAFRPSGRARP